MRRRRDDASRNGRPGAQLIHAGTSYAAPSNLTLHGSKLWHFVPSGGAKCLRSPQLLSLPVVRSLVLCVALSSTFIRGDLANFRDVDFDITRFYPHDSLMDYVTAIFGHLVEPIFQLYQKLIAGNCSKPNEVQTSPVENGYAISLVTLSAFLIESVCGRACFVKRIRHRMSAARLFVTSAMQT
jgi:hypothetical protein